MRSKKFAIFLVFTVLVLAGLSLWRFSVLYKLNEDMSTYKALEQDEAELNLQLHEQLRSMDREMNETTRLIESARSTTAALEAQLASADAPQHPEYESMRREAEIRARQILSEESERAVQQQERLLRILENQEPARRAAYLFIDQSFGRHLRNIGIDDERYEEIIGLLADDRLELENMRVTWQAGLISDEEYEHLTRGLSPLFSISALLDDTEVDAFRDSRESARAQTAVQELYFSLERYTPGMTPRTRELVAATVQRELHAPDYLGRFDTFEGMRAIAEYHLYQGIPRTREVLAQVLSEQELGQVEQFLLLRQIGAERNLHIANLHTVAD